MSIEQSADSRIFGPPRKGPLAGVKIVDLSWHLAGPFCTLILADLGASVIKIEQPGSAAGYDPGGFIRHYYKGQDAHYMALNRNKKSVALNLKSKEGKAILHEMVREADVVFNNFRAGVMDRLGIGFEDLRKINPDIIFGSLTSFGKNGPYAARPGVDLVVQALSGGMSMTGEPGRPPVRAGIPLGDLSGGMWAAISILSALRARDQQGAGGREIDVSLLDGQIAMIPYFSAYYFLDGFIPGPQGSGGHSPTWSAYQCKGGRWMVIAVVDQKPWKKLCAALSRDDLLEDARFVTSHDRARNGKELAEIMAAEFARWTADEVAAKLERSDVPFAPVKRLDEALVDPQVQHRGMVVEIQHVLGDKLKFVGTPVRMSAFEPAYESPPLIGQHTSDLLVSLGYGQADISRMREQGVI
ncbi:MAG TPA: CaiB/BaiF CoA-transferase family protein [Rhodoblastus sp.]|nr:CaiB/BaiF CoA-transferase family protein [Rhodoblastus sp.]